MDNFSHFFMQQKILLKKSTILNQFKHGSRIERNQSNNICKLLEINQEGAEIWHLQLLLPFKINFHFGICVNIDLLTLFQLRLKSLFSDFILLVFFPDHFLSINSFYLPVQEEKKVQTKKKMKYVLYIKNLIHKSTF